MTLATRPVSTLAPGTSLARYALALVASRNEPGLDPADFAATKWKDVPHVEWALRQKAVVPAATTTDPAFAGVLARSGISGEVLPLLAPLSAFEAARPRMRQVPFLKPTPRQTTTGSTAYWIAEGAPIPPTSYAFDLLALAARKLCAVVIASTELQRYADPVGEALLRDAMLLTLAEKLDVTFLDATNAGGAGAPASITSTGTAIVSTGSTAAALTTDLAAMIAAIDTSGRGLTWFLKPTTLSHIGAMLGGGAASIPRTLHGIPVIVNPNVGAQIVLADLAEVVFATGDLEVELSAETAVEMKTDPTNSSTTPTATTMVSLFQTNSVALRVLRFSNWQVVRTGSVVHMAVTF